MSSLIITGGRPLTGEIKVQGSKNAALPLLAASILIKGITVLERCPDISDVACMLEILKTLGCTIVREEETVIVDAQELKGHTVSRKNAEKMRSSISLLGALLGREAQAEIPLPGGCSIGKRPVDLHLMALRKLGAKIEEKEELHANLSECRDAEIVFPYPSVGAVQNAILASVISQATVVMKNCAREPEVEELCCFLNCAGADIKGGGTDTIVVRGVKELHEIRYTVRADRIVAGTCLCMAASTQGMITVCSVNPFELSAMTDVFARMGCMVQLYSDAVSLSRKGRMKGIPLLKTVPYPGFPTDMQSQLMSLLVLAAGNSVIRETVFENRFRAAYELKKMQADITINEKEQLALIRGRRYISPARMQAPDLRGGAALVIAALAAEGRSIIEEREYIERGYQDMPGVIRLLGGDCENG